MKMDNIERAKAETKRFLLSIFELEGAMKKDNNLHALTFGSKETAACKRASLDLTRALAKLRNEQ